MLSALIDAGATPENGKEKFHVAQQQVQHELQEKSWPGKDFSCGLMRKAACDPQLQMDDFESPRVAMVEMPSRLIV
jgi:hypothetical protein